MGDQTLLSRAPPYFDGHVKLLAPAAFAVVSTHSSFKKGRRQAGGWSIRQLFLTVAESLSQHDEKHIVPTTRSGVGTYYIFFIIITRFFSPNLTSFSYVNPSIKLIFNQSANVMRRFS
jgi:hypothetical protein